MSNPFFRFLFVVCLTSFSTLVGAYDVRNLNNYKEKYADQMAVVLNHNQIVTIDVDSKTGELLIYETDFEEILYLKESSKFYTSQSIYTSDFFEDIIEVNVTVYNQKGKKHKLKKTDFRIVDSAPSSWVFHDDNKEMLFDLKDLGEGYRTIIEYKKRVKRPQFFDVFHFISSYPVENSVLEITCPTSIELKFYEQNFEKIEVKKETLALKKGKKKIVWRLTNLKPFKKEAGSVNNKNHIPHLIAQIMAYKNGAEKVELIGTPDQLHGFFQEFLLLRDEAEGSDDFTGMQAVVKDITADMNTDLEKMDTIFNWVQANIKYIAFEDGINGYVPRTCNKVMNNRYGDCKDMGNLLVEMLEYANVKGAHVAWVGTRDIPYQMSEIPTPLACNHVICVVDKENGGYYYLDATHAEGGYILPPRNVQSKELLIHNGMDDYTIFKVPEVDATVNYIKSVVKYKWEEDDSLRGKGRDIYGGYERENRSYSLSNLNKEDKYKYVKKMVVGGYNRYAIADYSVSNLDKKNEDLIIDYDFSVDNMFIVDGKDLIFNPILFKPRVTQYNKEDHSLTRFKKYHRTLDYQFEFEIPKGYKIKHLPKGNKYENDLFEFESNFKVVNNVVVVNLKYFYNLIEIPVDIYPDWNAFSTAINAATIQNIILTKI